MDEVAIHLAREPRCWRRRPTVTRLLVLWSALLVTPAYAGEAWELISVTRGAGWEVNKAQGTLERDGQVLQGILKDKTDGKADYEIRIELSGGQAKAHFRFISESDEGTTLTGTYNKAPAPTSTHCPEQIQLMNAFQYIGLARDACREGSRSSSAGPADTVARYFDYDEPPRILKQAKPTYPAEPFYDKVEGTVEIEFVIDEKGRVIDLAVVKSVPGLDKAALECVKKWNFKPAQKQGKPVKATALAPVTFRITHEKQ